jgi:tetratricopeptide (TPR) repeat protein
MQVQWSVADDPQPVKQLLQDYESQDGESREGRIQSLAALPNGMGVLPLCRLVRLEKSELLSKQAAVALLGGVKGGADPERALVESVRKMLSGSRRPAAQWLLTYVRSGEDPAAAAGPWSKLVEAEQALLQNASAQTNSEIVAALLRFQVARLKKLGRNAEAAVAIGSLIQMESGSEETLAGLIEWLMDQKAWQALDQVADRFAPQIAAEPMLTYALAEAMLAQGKKDRAEELARRALLLNPGKDTGALENHLLTAVSLQQRGLFSWALKEYRHVIAGGRPTDEMAQRARIIAAEMLHDQIDDLAAGEMLRDAVNAVGSDLSPHTPLLGDPFGQDTQNVRTLGDVRARMNLFFALHWESKGEQAKRRECLEKALRDGPTDMDVLIACYQLPDQTPEYHKMIVRLVHAAADAERKKIEDEPDDPGTCNNLAWLIANTEGDLQEALRLARKAVELHPDAGGYCDTLGRVYFAKGDYENAIKWQTKALELEPHSGLIRRALDMFQKKRGQGAGDRGQGKQKAEGGGGKAEGGKQKADGTKRK